MQTDWYGYSTSITRTTGPFSGDIISARVMCSDGVVRRARFYDGIADTFFSVPCRVNVQREGKRVTVAGYLTVETSDGFTVDMPNDPAVAKFVAYQYRKNHTALPRGAWKRSTRERGKQMKRRSEERAPFYDGLDRGDLWGSTMAHRFGIAHALSHFGADVPSAWQYRDAMGCSDIDSEEYPDSEYAQALESGAINADKLTAWGDVLARYSDLLRHCGKDY